MNVPCDEFSHANAIFGRTVLLRRLQEQPVLIPELHSVPSVIQKTKCVGVVNKPLCVFALHFLKLVEIAIVAEKNFGTFLLQVCTHLLSVIDRVFELAEVVVALNADNEGANFLSCVSQALHSQVLHKAHPFSFTRTFATKESSS